MGSLERTEPYSRGRADEAVVLKLTEIRAELRFSPWLSLCVHECSFCLTGEEHADSEIPMGAYDLWIPGDGVIYVAPELVTHYVEAHSYLPPREFQQAVQECPLDPQRYANALVHAAPASMKENLAGALDSWLEDLPELRAKKEERKKREFRWSWKDP